PGSPQLHPRAETRLEALGRLLPDLIASNPRDARATANRSAWPRANARRVSTESELDLVSRQSTENRTLRSANSGTDVESIGRLGGVSAQRGAQATAGNWLCALGLLVRGDP